jgi:hypothetical protein
MSGRPTNVNSTVTITVSTTPQVKRGLEKLVKAGTFGKSPAEAAERIISEKLWALASEGKGLKITDLEESAT